MKRKGYITIIVILLTFSLVYFFSPKNAFYIFSNGEKIESITFGTYYKLGTYSDHSETISDPEKIEVFSRILNSKRVRRTFDSNIFNQAESLSFFVFLVDEKGQRTGGDFVAINHQGKITVNGDKYYITDPLLYDELYKYFKQIVGRQLFKTNEDG
ncbi:hypothetical protein IM538_13200 [Cytobacillus suaedae]|nr:hypothetical protein IM538_13200 [Cytobacillus suaedae]